MPGKRWSNRIHNDNKPKIEPAPDENKTPHLPADQHRLRQRNLPETIRRNLENRRSSNCEASKNLIKVQYSFENIPSLLCGD